MNGSGTGTGTVTEERADSEEHADSEERKGPSARTLHLVVGAFVALLPLVVHHDLLRGDVVWYALDHAQLHVPRFAILCEALQGSGELPHWQHALYAGSPFHANPELPTLYPPALLVAWLFEPVRAVNLFIALHMVVGAAGAYCFAGALWRGRLGQEGHGTLAAALVATLFTLNYYTRLENLNLVEYGAAHMLLPWILFTLERLWRSPRPGPWAAALALFGGLLANSGGLYVLLFGSLFCAIWALRFGLFDGPDARRRTLRWVAPAVLVAGLLALAKLLPYFEWLPTTNRSDAVSEAIASGRALGGPEFSFATLLESVLERTGRYAGLALFLVGAVAGLRHAALRLSVAVVLVTLVFAAGPLYSVLYALGSPFTVIRTGPERLWTLINVAWPVVAGLGTALALGRVEALRRDTVQATVGVALSLALLPQLLVNRAVYDNFVSIPVDTQEILSRYEHWPRAAENAGDAWRVWWIGKPTDAHDGQVRTLGGQNEQFVTTLLGAETLAGFLGYIWPRTLERHLYFGADGVLPEGQRSRRAGVLSARWLVTSAGAGRPVDTVPKEVDGRMLVENRYARPRAFGPRMTIAVVGDAELDATYALLDDVVNPMDTTLVHLPTGAELEPAEAACFDAVLRVGDAAVPSALANVEALRVGASPSPDQRLAAGALFGDEQELRAVGELERDGPNRTRVTLEATDRDRVVVVSETWSTNVGWRVEVDGAPATVRRADGIASAVFVPAGATTIAASYRAPGTGTGFALGLAGLVGVGLLVAAGLRTR